MAGTQVKVTRDINVSAEADKRYRIQATCVVAGDLTDTSIFLLDINNVDDPKDDTLNRVIDIADVDESLNDRDAAIAAGDATWRSPSLTLLFADIETALAAWHEFSSRINKLVELVDDYNTDFATPGTGEVVVYPTADTSAKNELIAAYEATAEPLADATTARDEKALECTQLETDLDTVQARLIEAEADASAYSDLFAQSTVLNGAYPGIYNSINVDNASIRSNSTTSDATEIQKDTIESFNLSIDSQLVAFTAQNTALDALNSSINGISSKRK